MRSKVTLGELIKRARLQRGLTQTRLASSLGYNSSSIISQFESGSKEIPANILPKLSELTGISLQLLVDSRIEVEAEKIRHGVYGVG